MKTETLTTDVLVIGAGMAGTIAAIEARKAGADVTLVSKSALGKESSASFARTFMAHKGEHSWAKQIPGYDDKRGKYIEDWSLINVLVEETSLQLQNLVNLGVPLIRVAPEEATEKVTVWRPRGSEHTHGGAITLDILAARIKEMGIRPVEGCSIISLLKDGNCIVGASGLLHRPPSSVWISIHAREVVLATGGASGIADITSTSREVAGNGHAMALRAGLALRSMEFNSFYPVGIPTPTSRYVHCAPATLTMRNALLLNSEGDDIVKKHFGITLQEGMPALGVRFDWLPKAVAAELETDKVWLNLTKVPTEDWDRLPERNWKQIRQTQVDLKTTAIPIHHLSQQFYGGVVVDTRMRTALSGLCAAGEMVAGWRADSGLGHITSCLAMGAIAGRTAAAEVSSIRPAPANANDDGLRQARAILGKEGKGRPGDIVEEIRRIVRLHLGPVKSRTSLDEGLKELELVETQLSDTRCREEDLKDALEARAMVTTSKAMFLSSLLRTESRGGFFRKDFPKRDDASWLRPVMAELLNGEVKVRTGEPTAY